VDFPVSDSERLRRVTLVTLALVISAVFLWMVSEFLIALLLAAITAGMLRPLYVNLSQRFKNRRTLAASVTLALLVLLVILPLVAFTVVVADQAVELGRSASPWLQTTFGRGEFGRIFERYPSLRPLEPYRDQILTKLGELGGQLGALAVAAATAAAQQVATFLLLLFVMLYATFFFLTDGRSILRTILYYSPLPSEDEDKMLDRFSSVARATIRGTLVVGLVQGALGGIAFWVAGI
jgi:predicted PurR-regulated permease PerM